MKKIILGVAAICMMAVTSVSAQDFTWGAKVGMNLANISYSDGDYGDADKSRLGFAVGLMGEYKFSETMAVSADLMFSAQGDKYKEDDYTEKEKLSYLNIPILFNYYVIEGLAVKAGIQPGFLLGAKSTYEYDDEKGDESSKDYYNSIDFAIPVGVSYDITESIVIDARYNIGVANIAKDADGYSAKNNVFQLTVGYRF